MGRNRGSSDFLQLGFEKGTAKRDDFNNISFSVTGFGKIAGLYVRLLVCGRKPKDPRNYLSCCSWIFHLNNTIGTLKLLFLFSIYLLLLSLPFYYLFVFIICVFLLFCHYLSIYPATNQSFTFYICQFIN